MFYKRKKIEKSCYKALIKIWIKNKKEGAKPSKFLGKEAKMILK